MATAHVGGRLGHRLGHLVLVRQHGGEILLDVVEVVVLRHHGVVHPRHLMAIQVVHAVLLDTVDMVRVAHVVAIVVPAVLPHLPAIFLRWTNVAVHWLGHCTGL